MDNKSILRIMVQNNADVPMTEILRRRIERDPPGMREKPDNPHTDADRDCKLCDGYGWKKSMAYGTWFVCGCVTTNHEKWKENLQPPFDPAKIGLTHDELELTWDKVVPDISDGVKAMEPVREAYQRGHGMIFLWGKVGQAKTLVGKILTATAYRDGKRACYTNMSSALDNIKLAFDDTHQSTELLRRMEWWNNRDVLFVDEIDKTNKTEWAYERMFQFMDNRYQRAIREEALTVIASNQSVADLDEYLKSRLQDHRVGPVVYLNGPDGRQYMQSGYKY